MFSLCSLYEASRSASMARIMKTDQFILALLGALPERRVEGKKRLQKLVYFLNEAGADSDASFFLKNFGPYSAEVDNATILLTIFGGIEETSKTVGSSDYLTTVYSLPQNEDAPQLETRLASKLRDLNQYSTIDLEIASTIHLFQKQGNSYEDAVRLTKNMKPTKANEKTLQRAPEILRIL